MLITQDLTKIYGSGAGEVVAVNHLTCAISDGDFVSIIGKSGCGKSTLLHLLAGLDRPTSGKIYFNDTDICSLSQDKLAKFRRREIGVIYQFYNLLPILSVEENITLPVRLDYKKPDKDKLEEILSLLNLQERRGYLPNQLSGGQQQRVAIGRALFINPTLVLADEPTGNLDKNNGKEVMDYLEMLNTKFNQTIILVTHDEEVANKAKRRITLSDGAIVEDIRLK